MECEGHESWGSGLPSRVGFLPGWAGRQRRWRWNRTSLLSSHCASAELVITGAHTVSIPLWFQVPRVGLRRSLSSGTSRSQLSGHQWRRNFTAHSAPFSKVNWSEQEDTPSCCGSTCMGPSLWGGLGAVERVHLSSYLGLLKGWRPTSISILFLYFLGVFIPVIFLNYYSFDEQKPFRPARFRGIISSSKARTTL